MIRNILILALILSCSFIHGVEIYNDGGESMKITSQDPQGNEAVRLRFEVMLGENLALLETASAICFETDDSFNVQAGAKAWGIQWLCQAPSCSTNLLLGSYFIVGSANSAGGYDWMPEEDLTNGSFWTTEEDDGTHLDTTIAWESDMADKSNLPDLSSNICRYM